MLGSTQKKENIARLAISWAGVTVLRGLQINKLPSILEQRKHEASNPSKLVEHS